MPTFFEFLKHSPTPWHAAETIGKELEKQGFIRLKEQDSWNLKPLGKYFVEREGSLIAAFRLPSQKPESARLIASHIDSPALKIKPHPNLVTKEISQLLTEIYGGPLLHAWLDREIAISGRIVTDKGAQLVDLSEFPLIIPELPIHLDRTMHEKGILVHKQDHLKPIFSLKASSLEELLKKKVHFEKLYAFDLFLVPIQPPLAIGLDLDLISGYRIDNLSSAYSALQALILAEATKSQIQMSIFWDHEEIGSETSTGAGSFFVDQILDRILIRSDREEFHRLKSRSLTLSVDVAHGWNPNYPEKYDSQNTPLLGKGPAVKFNAGKKYSSDAISAAFLFKMAEKHKIPLQQAANRSDIPSGSTVGPIMSANTGILTLDIGLACLAMHSTREVIAKNDLENLTKLLQAVLEEEK